FGLPYAERPAAQVQRRGHQRLVHRHGGAAVTPDARLVPQGLGQGFAKTDADVFHRVMSINVQITLCLDAQIDEAVLGEEGEHMIEEADAAGQVGLAGAVEIDGQPNLGLSGVALNRGTARHEAYSTVSAGLEPRAMAGGSSLPLAPVRSSLLSGIVIP